MIWKNLEEGKCPKCSSQLYHNPAANVMICRCKFKIGMDKFKSITSSTSVPFDRRSKPRFDPSMEEPNREDLNAL